MIVPTDPQALRVAALCDLVGAAEAAHRAAVVVYDSHAPSREACIVAVLDKAAAYWQGLRLAERSPPLTVEECRAVAAEMVQVIDEQTPGVVLRLLAQDVRTAARRRSSPTCAGPEANL